MQQTRLHDSLFLPLIHEDVRQLIYLNAPRTRLYRPIVRYLFLQRKLARYALPSEEVFEFVQESYPGLEPEYSLDDCEEDLMRLSEFGAVKIEQQRGRANTIAEIRKRRLRVQIGDHAIAVEEALLALEQNRSVRGALDASWLDAILIHLRAIEQALAEEIPARKEARRSVWGDWGRVQDAFRKLGDNAHTFYAPFYETRVLDLIDADTFHRYKERLVEYIQNFGERLISDAGSIRSRLAEWDRNGTAERLLAVVAEMDADEAEIAAAQAAMRGESAAPTAPGDLREMARVQYAGFQEWFAPDGTYRSLSDAAVYAIEVIVKFARRIANEGRVPAARQRQWQRLANMFSGCTSLEDAHRLAGVALGCAIPRHLMPDGHAMGERESVWEQPPRVVSLRPVAAAGVRAVRRGSPIEDDTPALERIAEQVRERMAAEREVWNRLFSGGEIHVANLHLADSRLRDLLVDVIGRCLSTAAGITEGPDGSEVRLQTPSDPGAYGQIHAPDGTFVLPAYRLRLARPEGINAGV